MYQCLSKKSVTKYADNFELPTNHGSSCGTKAIVDKEIPRKFIPQNLIVLLFQGNFT